MSSDQPDKKIIIDEDWKSQVEAEKEAARNASQSAENRRGPTAPGGPQSAAPDAGAMPPPDFGFLIGTLYIQGAMALGLLVNPVTKKADVQLPQAKHAIDLLAMLQQKTEGNRTPEESDELETALHELRMAFVYSSRSA